MTVLAPVGEVERMLATIETVSDAASVARAAAAMKEVARQAGMSLEEQNRAAEAKIRAEYRGGLLLRELERGQGANVETGAKGFQCSSNGGQTLSPYAAALEGAGLSRQAAARWQKIADLGEERLGELVAVCREKRQEITTAFVLRAWRREEKNEKPPPSEGAVAVGHLESIAESGAKFGTVYADPPWLYGNQGTRGATGDHYPGMTVPEICALPVRGLVAPSAHLHLWTTNAFLFDAREVMEAWGFTYKSCFVWVKPQMGMGNYWRVSHEFCLFGVRGSAPFGSRSEMSWREWPRGRHSAKPMAMYSLIEKVSPGPYLEMFGRQAVPGWTVWGNQIEDDLFHQTPAEDAA